MQTLSMLADEPETGTCPHFHSWNELGWAGVRASGLPWSPERWCTWGWPTAWSWLHLISGYTWLYIIVRRLICSCTWTEFHLHHYHPYPHSAHLHLRTGIGEHDLVGILPVTYVNQVGLQPTMRIQCKPFARGSRTCSCCQVGQTQLLLAMGHGTVGQ